MYIHLFLISLQPVIEGLLSCKHKLSSLITRFQEFLEYDDVRYYTMNTALRIVKEQSKEVITLLTAITHFHIPVVAAGD